MGSAYGLLLSTAFSDAEVALALVPILIIPLMLVGGFFAPNQNVPDFFRIF
jgi:ATP-binding cassette subfamily G (WHITE) protein 1